MKKFTLFLMVLMIGCTCSQDDSPPDEGTFEDGSKYRWNPTLHAYEWADQ